MEQWKPVFIGVVGSREVSVERGDAGTFRVKTVQQGTEIVCDIHGESPGDLEQNLREQGRFSTDEAHEIVRQLLYR